LGRRAAVSSQGKLYALLTWHALPSSAVARYRVLRAALSWQACVGSTRSTSRRIPVTRPRGRSLSRWRTRLASCPGCVRRSPSRLPKG